MGPESVCSFKAHEGGGKASDGRFHASKTCSWNSEIGSSGVSLITTTLMKSL